MVEPITDLPKGILGFSATGTVTGADYETVIIPAVEALLEAQATARLLYHLGPEFEGFEAEALWDDARVGLRHMSSWERIAVVTDVTWIRGSVKAFGFIMPGVIRVFGNDDLTVARNWLAS